MRAEPEGEVYRYGVNGSWIAGRVGRSIGGFCSIMTLTHDEENKLAEYLSYNKCYNDKLCEEQTGFSRSH
jgi:hypothetical protein